MAVDLAAMVKRIGKTNRSIFDNTDSPSLKNHGEVVSERGLSTDTERF